MIGKTVGPYRIESIAGRSRTDDLLAATTENGLPVLLQLFRVPLSYQAFARDLRWTRNVVTKIEHEDIVPIVGVERFGEEWLLFRLPHREGVTFRTHLSQMRDEKKGYSEEEALTFTSRLASTLAPALRMGMVHRYLQPHNILVRPDGAPALLGLDVPASLAKVLIAASDDEFLGYLSPEQRLGLLLDGRSNIYSLGVLLYEMLTLNASDFSWNPQTQELPPLKEVLPDLNPSTYRIVDKCLQPESWARYQTYDELLTVLGASATNAPAALPRAAVTTAVAATAAAATVSATSAADSARKRAMTRRAAPVPWWRQQLSGAAMPLLALLAVMVFVGFAWSQAGQVGDLIGSLTANTEPTRTTVENEPVRNLTATPTSTPAAGQTRAPVIVTRATDSTDNIAAGATATAQPTATTQPTAAVTEAPTAIPTGTPTSAPPSPTSLPSPTPTETQVIVPPTDTPVPTSTSPPPLPTSTATSPPPPPPPPQPTATPPPTATPTEPAPPTATPPPPVPPSPTATSVTAPVPTATPTATPPIIADYEW